MTNKITGRTRLVGLFASPSDHSISPMMHNTAFQSLGVDAVYLSFEVGKDTLPRAIQSIQDFGMLGANLSMPNKTLAVKYMDELSKAAQLIGAINTITNNNGKLIGDNTDGKGFMRSLGDIPLDVTGKKITILGTGGAAMAIIAQAALDGVKEIAVYNRRGVSFESASKRLKNISNKTNCIISLKDLSDKEALSVDVRESTLLVNATSVGMKPLENMSPIQDFSIIREDLAVYDLIYTPRETEFLKQAKKRGAKTINGLGMLLYQGAEAFQRWTNREMPLDQVRKIIKTI